MRALLHCLRTTFLKLAVYWVYTVYPSPCHEWFQFKFWLKSWSIITKHIWLLSHDVDKVCSYFQSYQNSPGYIKCITLRPELGDCINCCTYSYNTMRVVILNKCLELCVKGSSPGFFITRTVHGLRIAGFLPKRQEQHSITGHVACHEHKQSGLTFRRWSYWNLRLLLGSKNDPSGNSPCLVINTFATTQIT